MPALLAVMTLFSSCSKDYESPLSGRTIPDMTFESGRGEQSVELGDVSHITAKVTIVSEAGEESVIWCSANTNGNALVVNVSANTTYSTRKSVVDVYDTESNDHVSFNVTQKQNDAILPVDEIIDAPYTGGLYLLQLKTNVTIDWMNIISDYDNFINAKTATSRGLVVYKDYITVAENTNSEPREGYVEYGNNATGLKAKVLVRQAGQPYIRFASDVATIGEAGGELDIEVSTNVTNFVAEPEGAPNWLTVGAKTKLDKNKYSQKLNVQPLPSNIDSRRCIVNFVKPGLTYGKQLTVIQSRQTED